MITRAQLRELFPGRAPSGSKDREALAAGRDVYYDLYRDGVTQGTLNKWLTCPESARLGIEFGLSGSRNVFPLEFGSVFHEILEDVYGWFIQHPTAGLADILIAMNGLLRKRQEAAFVNAMAAMQPPARIDTIDFTYALAEAVARRYFRAWSVDFELFDWVSLEYEFEFWDPHEQFEFPLRGKIDGVFRDVSGNIWLFETKTKSVIDNDNVKMTLPLNMQVGLYSWVVEQQLGQRPVGVLYNMVRRPGQRRKVRETSDEFIQRVCMDIDNLPNDYFQRYECAISPDESRLFQSELRNIIHAFEQWYIGLGPHYRNSNSCSVGPFTCEYLAACGMGRYDELVEKEFIYPELPLYRASRG